MAKRPFHRPRPRPLAVGVPVAAAVVAATTLALATGTRPQHPSSESLAGTSPSGAPYRVRVAHGKHGTTCLRLTVISPDGSAARREDCLGRPRPGEYTGSYDLNCETGDLFVVGLTPSPERILRLIGRHGSVDAKMKPVSERSRARAFVLAASAAALPGRVAAVDASGTASRKTVALPGRDKACQPQGGEPPSVAFGDL